MSRMIASIALLGLASTVLAAPREKPPSPEAMAVGDQFARQLGVIAQMIDREYVRPVATNVLYVQSVKAIFDEARQPHPDSLLRDLRDAKDESARIELVKLARARLHGAKVLEGNRDLFLAVSSFTKVLDPHSLLVSSGMINGTETANTFGFEFDGEDMASFQPLIEGQVPGLTPREVGRPAAIPSLPFRVVTVKPGSPAQRAGLRPGDIVRTIDGIDADFHHAAKAYMSLHSQDTNKVHQVAIDRVGCKSVLKLKLERTAFVTESLFGVTRNRDNSWDYWLDRDEHVAYVRLAGIENDSGDRLQEILHDLRDVRGLVFDLRWCPGGYIDPATQIASTFLESGVVAKMHYRNRNRGGDSVIEADGGLVRYKAGDFPVLLLVNGETTGGGELIAAAIRDNNRAVLAGTRTFGKASIQWAISIPGLPGYSFKVTGGTYSRPNGKSLQRFPDSRPSDDWGLRPDPGYKIHMSADLSRQLKEMHLRYVLRPGSSREAMELDDPAADPQRARALKLMRRLIAEQAKKEQ